MPNSDWTSRGKTVAQLIAELQSFSDQNLEVRISVNQGKTSVPISLVGKCGDVALLKNCEDAPSLREH